MSHNVTVLDVISPTQILAVEALAAGSSVTAAAKAAGVARETVSRWVHHDPIFLAELHNTRADLAAQTRYALEALGMKAVATLCEALQDQPMRPTRLRAACAILKLIGADRAETLEPITPLDVQLRLREHEEEMRQRQAKLDANEVNGHLYPDVTPETEPEAPATAYVSSDRDEDASGNSADQSPELPASQAVQNPGSDEACADHPQGDSGATAMERRVRDMMKSSAQSTSRASSPSTPRVGSQSAGQGTVQPSQPCRSPW
jgi:hypothetical protein